MKEKKVFIYLVTIWFILLGVYIYIEKTGMKIFSGWRTDKEKVVEQIGIKEAQDKIDTLLIHQPIIFPYRVSSFENNQSYTEKNQETLNRVVSLLKRVESNIFTEIASHSDLAGTSSKNRILSQKRADTVLEFLKTKYSSSPIDAIGYGEEFPLNKAENTANNRCIEITLHALVPKI